MRGMAMALLLVMAAATPAPAQRPDIPPTPRLDAADTLHGVVVADPYRWLENLDAPEVRAWARAQDSLARAWLEAAAGRDWISARLRRLAEVPDHSLPLAAGGRLFFLLLDPRLGRNVLHVQEPDGRERLLLDPASLDDGDPTALTDMAPDPSGEFVLVTLSREVEGRSSSALVRVADGRVLDPALEDVRHGPHAWLSDGSAFVYIASDDAGGGEAAYLRPVGGAPSQPRLLFRGRPGERLEARTADQGRGVVIRASGEGGDRVLWADLGSRRSQASTGGAEPAAGQRNPPPPPGAPTVIPLLVGEGAHRVIGSLGDTVWLRTTKAAPRGRVVAVAVREPGRARTVIPEAAATLDDAFLFGGRLVASYLADGRPHLEVFERDGRRVRRLEVPFGLIWTDYLRDWPGFAGSAEQPAAFFRSLNLLAPGVYRLDVRTGEVAPWRTRDLDDPRPAAAADSSSFVTRHAFVTSRDGTRVPVFLAHRADVLPDGSAPALLYAYGAYGFTPVPFFNAKYRAFLEAGGVFVIPYIRGGGVYGQAWHEAGKGARKQNGIDDIVAAAEWLVAEGWAAPGRVALEGQGPAGAAVGGAFTQRPDLWGAALFDVAVLDMLRRERFTGGARSELGSVTDAAVFRALHAYSPYHAVRPGVRYPPALLKTGEHDRVVHPMHAFKTTAALQRAAADGGPALLRVDWSTGHGFDKALDRRIAEWTDDLAFLFGALGMSPPSS